MLTDSHSKPRKTHKGLKINPHFSKPPADPFAAIEWEKRNSSITNPDGSVVFKMENIRIPKGWAQVIPPPIPGPDFTTQTPPPDGANPNPIKAGECKVFCLRITGRCMSPGACIRVRWVTTGQKGEPRARGVVRCCWPAAGAP